MGAPVVRSLIGAALLALCDASVVFAQQAENAELLSEIRTLRQTIETVVATGIRVQIVFGRLQIQEQRTVLATQRLDEARQRLTFVTDQIADAATELKRATEAAEGSRDAEQREQLVASRRYTESYLARLEQERGQAAAAQAEAEHCLALEQGQWSDLSQRLEDLERSLTRRK